MNDEQRRAEITARIPPEEDLQLIAVDMNTTTSEHFDFDAACNLINCPTAQYECRGGTAVFYDLDKFVDAGLEWLGSTDPHRLTSFELEYQSGEWRVYIQHGEDTEISVTDWYSNKLHAILRAIELVRDWE